MLLSSRREYVCQGVEKLNSIEKQYLADNKCGVGGITTFDTVAYQPVS